MKVLLLPGLGVKPSLGSQGSFWRYLAEGLRDRGVHVMIGSADPEWMRLGTGRSLEILASPSFSTADVVHGSYVDCKGILRALSAGRPVVLTHHGCFYVCPAGSTLQGCPAGPLIGPCAKCPRRDLQARLKLYRNRILGAFHRVHHVVVSPTIHRRLGCPRSVAILPPQPLLKAPDVGEDNRLIGFAGRLTPEKGLDLVLRSLVNLPDLRLEVAGEGSARPELQRLAIKLGLGDRVRFLGFLPLKSVHELYTRAAAVVVPSVCEEAFGYSAAEAMALGRAVIASRAGGLQDILKDERGWLCSTTDIAEWVDSIQEALTRPAERLRRGSRAREFVATQLAPSCVAGQYQDVYAAAVGTAFAQVNSM